MHILTNSEIYDICQEIVTNSNLYSPYMYSIYTTMFNTGIRCEEATNKDLWIEEHTTYYELQTCKRGQIRNIELTSIHPVFLAWLRSADPRKFLYSASRIRSALPIFAPYPHIWCKRKEISTHIFRHNFIKQKNQDGMEPETIATLMGLNTLDVVNNYINSELILT